MKLENNLFILNVWYNISQMGDIFMKKTVVIDEKKRYLDCEEYFKNGIDNLIIKEGVKEIGIRAFAQNNLTNLIIPITIKNIPKTVEINFIVVSGLYIIIIPIINNIIEVIIEVHPTFFKKFSIYYSSLCCRSITFSRNPFIYFTIFFRNFS